MACTETSFVLETSHEQHDEARIPLHPPVQNMELTETRQHESDNEGSVFLEDDSDGTDEISSSDEDDDELVCPICLEHSPPRSMVAGHCQHSFCVTCLSQMLITKHKKSQRRNRRRREQSRTDFEEASINDNDDEANFASNWTKSIEGGGQCPLCRAPLPLKELKLIQDGSCLSDDVSFRNTLDQFKQQHYNNVDEEEGRRLVVSTGRRRTRRSTVASAVLSMIYGDHDERNRGRMDRLALSFCVLFMFSMTLIIIVVQVRLAGNFHNDYYNEADYYPSENDFDGEMKSVKCLPPMPVDCRENGLYQCPPKSQWFASKMIVLNETHPAVYETYPMQVASCTSDILPVLSASKSPKSEILTNQKYAWATLLGTGGWIRVERYASLSPCDGTELDVYVLDDAQHYTCHSPSSSVSQREGAHVGYAQKSCEIDPLCLLSSQVDLWSVYWLTQKGQVYAIFDERRRHDDLSSELDWDSELGFTMIEDEPTNQICDNAIALEPNFDSPYYFHDQVLVDSRTLPNSLCGVDNLNSNTGLWFQTTAPPRPRSARVQSTQLFVSVCSEGDWLSDDSSMSLLILRGGECDKFRQLPPDDLKCIASLSVNIGIATGSTEEHPYEKGDSNSCRYLGWYTLPNETYTIYFEGSSSLKMGGRISVLS